MSATQNLEVGLGLPVLLYPGDTPATCLQDKIGDMGTQWQSGFKPVYQCFETPEGNYCRRRATNGPVELSAVFAANMPLPSHPNLNISCQDALESVWPPM